MNGNSGIGIVALGRVLAAACAGFAPCGFAHAHPGSGIVVDPHGNVFVSDSNRGLVKFGADGKVTMVLKEAADLKTPPGSPNNGS